MSDSEPETSQTTTNVNLVKEKKPRTPAQVEATNKALEALANARRAKAEAKKNEGQVIAKRTTTTTKIVKPKTTKPKPVPEPVVPAEAPKPIPTYREEFSAFKDEIKGMLQYKHKPEKKVKRKVIVEESDSDNSVEEVVIRKKKVKEPAPIVEAPPQPTDNRHLLEQIFFRRH